MSQELVLHSVGREAYNLLNGTESEPHDDILTAEQAARINDAFDIEIHLGRHGSRAADLSDDPWDRLHLSAQIEYDEVAKIVDGMQAGDTLLLEGPGFKRQPPAVPEGYFAKSGDAERARLEAGRQSGAHNSWDYLDGLATLKGIRVVYADMDAFENDAVRELSQGKDVSELTYNPGSEAERDLAARVNARRNLVARNRVKDYALAHLPAEGTPPPEDRKPKLVEVIGWEHGEGLEQAFDDVHLHVSVHMMRTSDLEERMREQYDRLTTDAERAAFTSKVMGTLLKQTMIISQLSPPPVMEETGQAAEEEVTTDSEKQT